ncbi:MAG: sigma-70 family RNA polymerase sigma factor [Balneolales bacterium]
MSSSSGSASSKEDLVWVTAAQNGDDYSYGKLVEKYNKPLYFHIMKVVHNQDVVEDLVQDIFMKAFKNIDSFNREYAFSTWLYRIATNHSIDFLRKKKLKTYSLDRPINGKEGDVNMEIPDFDSETDREIIHKERKSIIEEAIDSLPERYREVIQLRHMEEKSYQEISDLLDLPLGTIKAHLFRARELLNKYLKDKRSWM